MKISKILHKRAQNKARQEAEKKQITEAAILALAKEIVDTK